MARSRDPSILLQVPGITTGFVMGIDPDKVAPSSTIHVENMEIDDLGDLAKRPGCFLRDTYASGSTRMLSMKAFRLKDGVTVIIRHLSDGTVQTSTDSINWTTRRSGISTSVPMAFELFDEKIYMTNSVDDYARWDHAGATLTTYASAPKGRFLKSWKDSMWVANNDGAGLQWRVYKSNAGDATTFGATAFFDVGRGQGSGGDITGLAADGSALIVFKRHEHWAVFDPVEFTNRIVDSHKGAVSHFSIIEHDGAIYFFSVRGICQYLGDGPAAVLTNPHMAPFFNFTMWNLGDEFFIQAYSWLNRVGWNIPLTGLTDFIQLEMYPDIEGKPFLWNRRPLRFIAPVYLTSTGWLLLGGHHNAGVSLAQYHIGNNQGTDNGTAFVGRVRTGWFDFDAPDQMKYLRHIRIKGRNVFSYVIYADFDGGTIKQQGNLNTLSGNRGGSEVIVDLDVYGRTFQFEFIDGQVGGQFPINYKVGNTDVQRYQGHWSFKSALVHAKALGVRR